MEIDWSAIDKKWQKKWLENNDHEIDSNNKEKKFITVAYPYPNSPQHIGHGRTYTIADVHSRYLRMKGFNVLFPMGFHYTGTPILGMAKRVEANDAELIEGFKTLYKVPEDKIKEFVEPVKIADYFHEEIKSGMIEMGYSIDWRREGRSTHKLQPPGSSAAIFRFRACFCSYFVGAVAASKRANWN